MAKLTDKNSFIGTLQSTDLIHIVDVNDLSQSPAGSSYKLTLAQLNAFLASGVTLQQVLTNNPSTGGLAIISPNTNNYAGISDSTSEIRFFNPTSGNYGGVSSKDVETNIYHRQSLKLNAPAIALSQNGVGALEAVTVQQLQAYALHSGSTAGGDLSGTYPNPTVLNSAVISKLLTSYVSGAGAVSSTDSILSAIQKLNGNIALVSGAIVYQGLWNASTNTPTLVSGVGTKGIMYKVSVAGTTTIDGISQWNVGDQIMFDGTTWDKLDGIATEVLSVNGAVGAVNLTTANISEVTNLYFTTARAITALTGQSNTLFTNGAGYLVANQTITLSGDITGSGTTTITTTLATVNANVGSFGSVSTSTAITVNAKGLITAISSTPIQIAESQVTGLVSDLAGKQSIQNYNNNFLLMGA